MTTASQQNQPLTRFVCKEQEIFVCPKDATNKMIDTETIQYINFKSTEKRGNNILYSMNIKFNGTGNSTVNGATLFFYDSLNVMNTPW